MISRIVTSAAFLLLAGAVWLTGDSRPAQACNKIAGCVMDAREESDAMMQDGRMNEAMREARDNVEAFRALREAEQGRPPRTTVRKY
ncbi:MAG: hypothetical protein J0I67_05025 [Bosea sp.]|nr:hypothetical protein [Bosea sp. (in: a-proteobacteria)]